MRRFRNFGLGILIGCLAAYAVLVLVGANTAANLFRYQGF